MPRFVPRQRKHKVRERSTRHGYQTEKGLDSNPTEIGPSSKNEKEEKRQSLKNELRSQQPVMSSKKKKRLDKYIVCKCPTRNYRWGTLTRMT